ncbi:hypothetical protein KA183_04850 [bacterium]|nr:hypothetical protein [bacterium]QQR56171.1 MAG: hypothetical protein IPG59_14290 [Candidatus Melainabacteria bacterium]
MTNTIALGIAGLAIVAGVAIALYRRPSSQSQSPLAAAVQALPTSLVTVLMEEMHIAAYPAYAAMEAVRFQGSRPSNYSTASKAELQQKLARAVEELSGGIQYIKLYSALELAELKRKPEQVLHEVRNSRDEEKGFLPSLAGIMEYQLSPLERDELDRSKTQQILLRNRRIVLDLAAAETICKQGQELLARLASDKAA